MIKRSSLRIGDQILNKLVEVVDVHRIQKIMAQKAWQL